MFCTVDIFVVLFFCDFKLFFLFLKWIFSFSLLCFIVFDMFVWFVLLFNCFDFNFFNLFYACYSVLYIYCSSIFLCLLGNFFCYISGFVILLVIFFLFWLCCCCTCFRLISVPLSYFCVLYCRFVCCVIFLGLKIIVIVFEMIIFIHLNVFYCCWYVFFITFIVKLSLN